MSHHALCRAYRYAVKQLRDCFAFGSVIKGRRCSMSVDVVDFLCRDASALESALHRQPWSDSRRIWLRDVEIIRRNAVADNFCQDRRATLLRQLQIFQSQESSPFSKHHTVSIAIK